MLIEIHRLRTFVIAAEERTFTHAARRLGFSQSAVSQQIRELEDELEVRLFERRGRTVVLTPAGERLLPLAMGMLRDSEQTYVAMEPFRGLPQGVLRIGATDTPGIYMMPSVLGRFSQAQPAVRATLAVGGESETLRAARDGELDLVVVDVEPGRNNLFGWEGERFMDDELVLVTHPAHPWARRGRIAPHELVDGTFIARRPDSQARQLGQERIAALGVNPSTIPVRFELDNTEGLMRAVKAGLGQAWVSKLAVTQDLALRDLTIVQVTGLQMPIPLWLAVPVRANEQDPGPFGLKSLRQLLIEAAFEMNVRGAIAQPVPVASEA